MNTVPVETIGETARDNYLDTGFNVPSPEERKGFVDEWYLAVESLMNGLLPIGVTGLDGDFYIDLTPPSDRTIGVEILNANTLTPALIPTVRSVLLGLPSEYSVDLCDCWGYLKLPDGADFPHFNVFVEKCKTLVYSESLDTLVSRRVISMPDVSIED